MGSWHTHQASESLFGENRRRIFLARYHHLKSESVFSLILFFCTLLFGIVFQCACTIRLSCLAHLLIDLSSRLQEIWGTEEQAVQDLKDANSRARCGEPQNNWPDCLNKYAAGGKREGEKTCSSKETEKTLLATRGSYLDPDHQLKKTEVTEHWLEW